eukprot:COSAG01_NODE_68367_length_264_cov_0.666667_2_plen_35_part_01
MPRVVGVVSYASREAIVGSGQATVLISNDAMHLAG